MSYVMYAKCPCRACINEASKDYNEIDTIFGWRNMGDGRKIPQSYCRKCRSIGCTADLPKCKHL